jgi:hypothetical protein
MPKTGRGLGCTMIGPGFALWQLPSEPWFSLSPCGSIHFVTSPSLLQKPLFVTKVVDSK